MTEGSAVTFEVEGSTGIITINRPERRNAINPEVVRGLSESLKAAEEDDRVRVGVVTGAGDKAFCAGADLGGMMGDSRVAQHDQRAELGALFEQMRSSRLPIVARVNGHALAGGFGLMLACDLVVATGGAEMGTPEINLGLWPFMISAIVRRDVPRKVALELMLTGRRMPASEGQRWGFVNRVAEPEALDAAVDDLVSEVAAKSPLIAGLGKRSFYRAEDLAFDAALDYLAGMLTVCLESEDTLEGVSAFMAKRAPQWKGR